MSLTKKQIKAGDKVMKVIEALVQVDDRAYGSKAENREDPERGWYQGDWRSSTGMCFAGWRVEQAKKEDGTRWLLKDPTSSFSHYLLPGHDFDWDAFDDHRPFAGETVGVIRRSLTTLRDDLTHPAVASARARIEGQLKELAPLGDSTRIIAANYYAQISLGLDDYQADILFAGSNTADDLRRAWEAIKRGKGSVSYD